LPPLLSLHASSPLLPSLSLSIRSFTVPPSITLAQSSLCRSLPPYNVTPSFARDSWLIDIPYFPAFRPCHNILKPPTPSCNIVQRQIRSDTSIDCRFGHQIQVQLLLSASTNSSISTDVSSYQPAIRTLTDQGSIEANYFCIG
jgi:hypothetical protein